jgi:hypothetical protein
MKKRRPPQRRYPGAQSKTSSGCAATRCDGVSAALLAHKLLRRAVEIASAGRRGRGNYSGRSGNYYEGRGGGRNAGTQAGHCHRVAIDLTRGGGCIYARRGERYRIRDLTGLAKNLGRKQRATQEHERRLHNAWHETSP